MPKSGQIWSMLPTVGNWDCNCGEESGNFQSDRGRWQHERRFPTRLVLNGWADRGHLTSIDVSWLSSFLAVNVLPWQLAGYNCPRNKIPPPPPKHIRGPLWRPIFGTANSNCGHVNFCRHHHHHRLIIISHHDPSRVDKKSSTLVSLH